MTMLTKDNAGLLSVPASTHSENYLKDGVLSEKEERKNDEKLVFSCDIMQKLKPLIPSLREKKRYLVFEIVSKTPVKSFELVSEAVQNSVLSFIGTKGTAKTGLMIIKDRFNMPKQTGIIKINNKYVDDLKAALALIKEIGGQAVIVRSRGVSGILRKTEKFMEG